MIEGIFPIVVQVGHKSIVISEMEVWKCPEIGCEEMDVTAEK